MQTHRDIVPFVFATLHGSSLRGTESDNTDVCTSFMEEGLKDVKRSTSYYQCLYSRLWRTVLALIAVVGIVTGALSVSGTPALAAGSLPCDIYAAAGTPCVAFLRVQRESLPGQALVGFRDHQHRNPNRGRLRQRRCARYVLLWHVMHYHGYL
jgi:hypothetical protein